MTVNLVPPLVPSLVQSGPRPRRQPDRIRPMPVAGLRGTRARTTVYGLCAVDARGRLADKAVADALGWRPGDRFTVRLRGDVLMIAVDPAGTYAVSGHGRIYLPAQFRHACAIAPGDRVLLAAEPTDKVLVIHPPAVIDAMIHNFRNHREHRQ